MTGPDTPHTVAQHDPVSEHEDAAQVLRTFAPPRVYVHRSTREFPCECPGRLDEDDYPLPVEVDCGHGNCLRTIGSRTDYVRATHYDFLGAPVCLACAAALWMPSPEDLARLRAEREASNSATRAILDSLFSGIQVGDSDV